MEANPATIEAFLMIAFVPGHVVNFREFKVLLMLNHIRSAILKVCESKFLRNGMIF